MVLVRQTAVSTPAIDCLYPYLDPDTPLMPDGSADIPLKWGGVLVGLGVLTAALAGGAILAKWLVGTKRRSSS
jgi:hypothetical protein